MPLYLIQSTGTVNWATAANWSSIATKSAARVHTTEAAPTATDDVIVDDWSSGGGAVSLTINTTSCVCKTLDCAGGGNYGGALVFTAGQTLGASGSVTFNNAGMTVSGTGTLKFNAVGTFTPAGLTFPGMLYYATNGTFPIGGTTNVGTLQLNGNVTFSGAYDITCGTLLLTSGNLTTQIVAGRTLNVTTAIQLLVNSTTPSLLRSTVSGTAATLKYTGADASTIRVGFMQFTDIDFSQSTPVNILDNWYGSTLLRSANTTFTITAGNATAAAVYHDAHGNTYTVDATIAGGTTLVTTCQTSGRPPASGTLTKDSGTGDATITFSAYTRQGIVNRTSADLAIAAQAGSIIVGTTISGVAGTYVEATTAQVQAGVNFGAGSALLGTLSAGSPVFGDMNGGM